MLAFFLGGCGREHPFHDVTARIGYGLRTLDLAQVRAVWSTAYAPLDGIWTASAQRALPRERPVLPIVRMHERHICGRKTLAFGDPRERMPPRISVYKVAVGIHDPNRLGDYACQSLKALFAFVHDDSLVETTPCQTARWRSLR